MTHHELILSISHTTGLTYAMAQDAFLSFRSAMIGALRVGDIVAIRRFGTFYVGERAARNSRNPRTNTPHAIPARKQVKFRVSRDFTKY